MRSVLLAQDLLTAMVKGVPGVQFVPEMLKEALSPDLFATAHALEQVRQGIPFREAYRNSAKALSQMSVPASQDALAAYDVDGFPGRLRPDLIREGITAHRGWIAYEAGPIG